MPLASKAQARYEFAHPETFDKDRILASIRDAGGMAALPDRKTRRRRKRMMISALKA